jgi:hypothetical protein
MPRISDIHYYRWGESKYVSAYTEIYGGSAGCNIVINGVTVSIGQSTNVAVWVRSVRWNWMLPLGENKDVFNGTNRIG